MHDLAELAALALVDDLARDADAVQARHQHQVAAGDADVGGEGRPLGADALLDDLDEHLVAAAEDLLDRRLDHAPARGPVRPARAGGSSPRRGRASTGPRRPISRSSSSISSISLRISCSSSGSISSSTTRRLLGAEAAAEGFFVIEPDVFGVLDLVEVELVDLAGLEVLGIGSAGE